MLADRAAKAGNPDLRQSVPWLARAHVGLMCAIASAVRLGARFTGAGLRMMAVLLIRPLLWGGR